jgi:DNA-binding GntR family transcriptional regulator
MSASMPFTGRTGPKRPQTASEFVAESLRRAILNGELAAGTRLGLAEVAAGFEVSATPVREALRELSFEGFVQFDPYRGGTVNAVTADEVAEIVRIRQVLEPIAIQEAIAAMTEEVLERASSVLEQMTVGDSWDEWVVANREFHNILCSTSPSKRLIAMIKSLQDQTVMFVSNALSRAPDLQLRADKEHRELLDAFRRGDAETAIELTLAHLAIPFSSTEAHA